MTEPVPGLLDPGEEIDLTNCDREPIHIPGAIQPHGLLLTMTEPDLIVRQCSENVLGTLGHPAAELVGRGLAEVLGAPAALAVTELAGGDDTRGVPVAPVAIGVPGPSGETHEHQLVLHHSGGLLVAELEPREHGVDPNRFVREVSGAMVGMQGASGVTAVSQRAAEEVKRLTGYDRVMVYRFDGDGHGEVIAEAREPRLDGFLGHHYPATDIPAQARALYLRQALRLIVDVDYEPSPIWPADNPVSGEPLDLGLATLRAVSPIHLQYLRNMGVTGTMVISLTRAGELWGMIACHHYSPHYIDQSVRAACRFIGGMLSFQFAREEESDLARERATLRATRLALLGLVRNDRTLASALHAGADLLLELCRADGVSVTLDGERVTVGEVPDAAVEAQLVEQLPRAGAAGITDRLRGELPEVARHTSLCGALALQLPHGVGRHIVWYRREWRHEVTWGGDPRDSLAPDLTSVDAKDLSPRRSFEAWSEAVVGRSRPWRPVEVEAGADLLRTLTEHTASAMRDQLAHVALHDSLTGLPNRALLMESLHQLLRSRPHGELAFAGLLFLDLDNFKLVNDSLGHRAGDALLQQVAERVNKVLRKGDIIGRLGGDEFVIVLPDVKDPVGLDQAVLRIQRQFETPFELEGSEYAVTASIGVAWADLREERSPADVLRDADIAMYEAKRRGRGRSGGVRAALNESRRRRVELEHHLAGAVDRDELRLEYQPLFEDTGRVAGLEALVRWESGSLGRIGPSEFIPIAEEVGLIEEIGAWVLVEAFDQLAALHRDGVIDVSMAVNLSARQLGDVGLPMRLGTLLADRGIPAQLATIEINEALLVASGGAGEQTLARVRELGVKVAIDDFGTGFSSLAYLRRLPADILKIDRSFVAELALKGADREIVGAVIELARRLGIRTVAEGVETPAQREILHELHCDLIQGFLLARPMPPDDVSRLLVGDPLQS
jgi:diguanylate cyclase (GGDEF)-like protein